MADFESSSNFKGMLQRSFIRGFLSGLLKSTTQIANTVCNELYVKDLKLFEFFHIKFIFKSSIMFTI